MTIQRNLLIAAIVVAFSLAALSCEEEEPSGVPTPAFTEQLPPGTYVADREGKRYELILDLGSYIMNVDGQKKYDGTWTLGAGKRVAIDDRNTLVCALEIGFGTYDWNLEGDKLSFDVDKKEDEMCEERKKDWEHDDWVAVPGTPRPSPSPASSPPPSEPVPSSDTPVPSPRARGRSADQAASEGLIPSAGRISSRA